MAKIHTTWRAAGVIGRSDRMRRRRPGRVRAVVDDLAILGSRIAATVVRAGDLRRKRAVAVVAVKTRRSGLSVSPVSCRTSPVSGDLTRPPPTPSHPHTLTPSCLRRKLPHLPPLQRHARSRCLYQSFNQPHHQPTPLRPPPVRPSTTYDVRRTTYTRRAREMSASRVAPMTGPPSN
jgi:hypothetical protein